MTGDVRRLAKVTALVVLSLLALVACSVGVPPSLPSPSPSQPGVAPVVGVPNCNDLLPISAPAELYRDQPVYVGNEMPTEEIRAWAQGKPGFQDLWIDRDHNGWIAVAFTEDVAQRQAELAAAFPDVGVVAVEVEHTNQELEALQQRVMDELGPIAVTSSGRINYGAVSIGLGVLLPERVALVEELFGGEPVCVEGIDAALAPKPGPQLLVGPGFRLIADEQTGPWGRTAIAWDQASLAELWRTADLDGEPAAVDFGTEVAIWFGVVYGSSCPNLRLDAVRTDHDRKMIYAEIVSLDVGMPCTADARGRAYVVAVPRADLPAPPFAVQLHSDAAGGQEERTIVEADLRPPGSVAAPGQVHGDRNPTPPDFHESGTIIEDGFEVSYLLPTHCGIEWLGVINEVAWRTEVPAGANDFVPPEWEPAVNDEFLIVTVLLRTGDPPTVTASANGHSIVYLPSPDDPPGCD